MVIQGLGSMAADRCLRVADSRALERGEVKADARARVMGIKIACENMVGSPTLAKHSEMNLSYIGN